MNNSITNFINDYIIDTTYSYAVMITGDWGSGKTFFIKDYINNHIDKEKFIYISLYGIKDTDAISKDIYSQILRKNIFYEKILGKLNNKKANILGDIGSRIAIDLCKNKGIDINQINKIYKNLVDLNKYIFIFDDLERSSIDINQILGYINDLVEHNSIKAIIVANEPKIENEGYKKIKEKLIANTIVYKSNIENIFSTLISNINDNNELKISLSENIEFLINKSNKNIRTFQFFLSKYKRAYNKICEIYDGDIKSELIKKIIEEMYESSINYKKGLQDEARNLDFISSYVYLDTWDKNKVENISNLYLKKIEKDKSQYKLRNLEYWIELEDEKVISLLDEIVIDIRKDYYIGEDFAKIIRIALILQDKGFNEKYLNNILIEMKKKSYETTKLQTEVFLNDGYFSGYYEKNIEMSKIFRSIIDEVNESLDKNLNKKDTNEINQILDNSDWVYSVKIWIENDLNNNKKFSLCEIQKLQYKIQKLNNKDMHKFRLIFDSLIFYKKDERFLECFKKSIEELKDKEHKVIKKNLLGYLINDINKKIKVL